METTNNIATQKWMIDETTTGDIAIWNKEECIATVWLNSETGEYAKIIREAPTMLQALQLCSTLFKAIQEQMPELPMLSNIGYQMTVGTVNNALSKIS